jgi:hypothetical protein
MPLTGRSDRWFGYKLKAWGWPRPPQGEPRQILEAFFEFLLGLVPATEIGLNRDGICLSLRTSLFTNSVPIRSETFRLYQSRRLGYVT